MAFLIYYYYTRYLLFRNNFEHKSIKFISVYKSIDRDLRRNQDLAWLRYKRVFQALRASLSILYKNEKYTACTNENNDCARCGADTICGASRSGLNPQDGAPHGVFLSLGSTQAANSWHRQPVIIICAYKTHTCASLVKRSPRSFQSLQHTLPLCDARARGTHSRTTAKQE